MKDGAYVRAIECPAHVRRRRHQCRDARARGNRGRLHFGGHASKADPGTTGSTHARLGDVLRVANVGDQGRARLVRRCVIQPFDVGQQNQRAGVHDVGDQGRESVVIA